MVLLHRHKPVCDKETRSMAAKSKPDTIRPVSSKHPEGGLVEFVDILLAIDATKPIAQLNVTTIADNNGGRIEL